MQSEGHVYSPMYAQITRLLEEKGFVTFTINLPEKPDDVFLEDIGSMNLDAVMLGNSLDKARLSGSQIQKLGDRVVSVCPLGMDSSHLYSGISQVTVDHIRGGEIQTQHLINKGHTNILHVDICFPDHGFDNHTFAGYERAMTEAGLTDHIRNIYFRSDDKNSWPAFENLFRDTNHPSAAVVNQDFTAVKCVQILNRLGLETGHDISVVAYYNTPWASETEPALSSMSVNEHEMAELVVDLATRDDATVETIVVTPELIVRQSSENRIST
jgi:LacI family transcriptional regulator